MENNKHTELPWSRIVLKTKQIAVAKFLEIDGKPAFEPIAQVDTNDNAEFIVTACNSYHSLKQQNEELIEQTAKLQADKDRLAELLKEAIVEYSVQQRHAGYEIIKNQYANAQQRIKQTLSGCGYKI